MILLRPSDHDERNYLRDLLFKSFPDEFFPRWIQELARAYREAHEYVYGRYQKAEAHDALGYDRRARVEDATQRLAWEFGIPCPPELNLAKNHSHRVLRSGLVSLTQCYSEDYRARPAVHRNELARDSWAGDLFRGPARLVPQSRKPVYGILLHGAHPDKTESCRVGYIQTYFPDADADRYITKVNLLERFPLPDTTVVPEEEIAKTTPMRPKRQATEKEG